MKKESIKKEKIRIGDIFEIYLTNDKKQFFQYVADDQYLGICDVVKVIDYVYDKDVAFQSSMLQAEPHFYRMTALRYGMKDGIFIKLLGQNYAVDISDVLFKQKVDNFVIIKNAKVEGYKTVYRIRKLGQTIDEAEVDLQTYEKMEHLAFADGISPAPAFKIGLLKKYDMDLMDQYQAEFITQFDEKGNLKKEAKKKSVLQNIDYDVKNDDTKTISLHFEIVRMDQAISEIAKIEDMLSEKYWDGHEVDLKRETAEIVFFVPKVEVKQVLEEFTGVLGKKSPKDIVIKVNGKKVYMIEKVEKQPSFFSKLFNID
jgi:hypothetical protein